MLNRRYGELPDWCVDIMEKTESWQRLQGLKERQSSRKARATARMTYIACQWTLNRLSGQDRQADPPESAEDAHDKVDTILENATYSGRHQIPAFRYALAEILEHLHPHFRDHIDVSIFRGDKQAWMEAGNTSLMNLNNILEAPVVVPTGQLAVRRSTREGPPAWACEPEWQLWVAETIQENSYGSMWFPPDAANLWPEFPWLSP